MNVIIYPERADWKEILKRPTLDTGSLRETVCGILGRVRNEGDKAVMEYEEMFDKVKLHSLAVTEDEFREAEKAVSIELKAPSCWHTRIYTPFILRRSSKGKRCLPCRV